MRRGILVVALVCTSVACGGLLGFGNDDEGDQPPPIATTDGGADSAPPTDAGARVCQKLVEDFASYTDNSQLPDAGWRRYFGEPDCGVLGFENGAFVATRPAPTVSSDDAGGGGIPVGVTACNATNMGIFRWFEGGVRSVECSFDVRVSSLVGSGDFFEYRVEGTSYGVYRASGGFNELAGVRGRVVASLPDGAVVKDEYQYDAGLPEAGVAFRVHAKLDLGGKPTFTWTRDDGTPAFQGELPDPGTPPLVQLYLGVTETSDPRSVTIDNVACESCQ